MSARQYRQALPLALAITLTLGLLATLPVAEAQPTGKVYRVGLILTTSPVSEMAGPEPVHPLVRAFVHGLRALGYVAASPTTSGIARTERASGRL